MPCATSPEALAELGRPECSGTGRVLGIPDRCRVGGTLRHLGDRRFRTSKSVQTPSGNDCVMAPAMSAVHCLIHVVGRRDARLTL